MKCTNCGSTAFSRDRGRCPDCGFAELGILVLRGSSPGKELPVRMARQELGRHSWQDLTGAAGEAASSPQCYLYRSSEHGCWMVQHARSARSVTHIDGVPIDPVTPARLLRGSRLTVGPDAAPLVVDFLFAAGREG
jgi:hypothetical protein